MLQHIFEPFVTGDADPAVSTRMGVGLKIVKHIVEMHHGRVNVESEPGKGTLFAVYLPKENRILKKTIARGMKLRTRMIKKREEKISQT